MDVNAPREVVNSKNIFSTIQNKGSETFQRLRGQVMERGSTAIFVILALITIAILIAFLVMKLKAVNTNGIVIVNDPLKLYNMTGQARVDASAIPPTVNGQEFSFSFWLYLVDFQPTHDKPQLIMMRSNDSTSLATANPIVALDGRTNRLYISIRTNASAATQTTSANFHHQDVSHYLTATVKYFPLQRWVHVVGVVKDESLSVYLNAALYTVANIADLTNVSARPIFAASAGSVVVGPAGVQDVREPRAYITQCRFFNYAVMPNSILATYTAGPTSTSFLSKLGLAGYGLRSPIYRIDA